MYQLHVRAVTYEFDASAYTRDLKTHLEFHTKLAARRFAEEALKRIPVRTGFVSGAFGTLTDLVGDVARLNPIITRVREFYHPVSGTSIHAPGSSQGILKTTLTGRQFATKTENILKWEGDILVFDYEVDITYFQINDVVGGFAPTAPWGAFVAGQKAFEDYMKEIELLSPLSYYNETVLQS